MHSTSRVTWLARTSATLAGRLILRLRSTLLLRERKPLRAVQRRTGNDPASRLGRSLWLSARATHRLVGLGRSPASQSPCSTAGEGAGIANGYRLGMRYERVAGPALLG